MTRLGARLLRIGVLIIAYISLIYAGLRASAFSGDPSGPRGRAADILTHLALLGDLDRHLAPVNSSNHLKRTIADRRQRT